MFIITANIMSSYMDVNADPCHDFYQYACGNWEVKNPIPKDLTAYDTFEILRENLDAVLKGLLEEQPKNKYHALTPQIWQNDAITKAKYFFQSCMNYGEAQR
jgi:predicted metalloendopeptidase